MLQVHNLSKSFGDNRIFERVSFVINPGDRIGLIGPNGCGKTTLLRILTRQLTPDAGTVTFSPATVRVGYLAQGLEYEPDQTVADLLDSTGAAQRLVDALANRLAAAGSGELPALLLEYEQALETLQRRPRPAEAWVKRLYDGLLRDLPPDSPVAALSGGQKTRLGLARLLADRPDLLLLDEPTNHLDTEALEWLEDFLRQYPGAPQRPGTAALLIVSHDRAFLNATVSTILELDPLARTAARYEGNYDDFVAAKQRAHDRQWTAYQDQQDFIARLEANLNAKKNYARSIEQGTIDFVPRKIAKGIARGAIVQQRRIQRLLTSEERVDRPGRSWEMKLDFGPAPETGRDVLLLEELSIGYGDNVLLHGITLTLRAGERRVLVGPNGSGKTTLARTIAGELSLLAGQVRLGAGVRLGYYAQEQETLDPGLTPYAAIRAVAPFDETDARSFLHYFLFAGDEVFTLVDKLSFGERARLTLARLVAQGCNLLLLDEPINHLDIPSRHRFEQAIAAFHGTVLAIVHDRFFIDRYATGLWSVEDDTIRAYIDRADLHRAHSSFAADRP
jgi:ATP-binding cassette subfamily F protein 3